jgi:hypothetical protein
MDFHLTDPPTARDLCRKVDLDWKSFAEWADPLLPGKFDPNKRPGSGYAKFAHGFHTHIIDERLRLVCPVSLSPYEFAMTAIAKAIVAFCADNAPTDSPESLHAIQTGFGRRLGARLWEIASLATLAKAKARRRVLLDKDYGYRRRIHLKECCAFAWERRNEISTAIWNVSAQSGLGKRTRNRSLYLGLRWARWVIRQPEHHERAFWAQLQTRLGIDARLLASAEEMIEQGRPLTKKCHLALTDSLSLGTVIPVNVRTERGMVVRLLMCPNPNLARDHVDVFRMYLTVPIAYRLAQQWADSRRWPQFVVACRNPLCGKQFYSARSQARTCPRRPGTARRSDCKAVWENYQKWLQKAGLDPETCWLDDNLKQEFLRQYSPRGPQS